MPKATRRSQRLAAANAATTTTTVNPAQFSAERNNIAFDCDQFAVDYEYHQNANGSRHTRLHISKRGELGPRRVPNNQQQQGQPRSNTIVINNDPSGLTLDVSSQNSDNNSLKIIITNSDN